MNVKIPSGHTNEQGIQVARALDLDETGVLVKGGPGQVFGWYLYNAAASVRYVKLYDKATAPTVGTDTPLLTICLPANGGANVFLGPPGIQFTLGIGWGCVTAVADNSTAAPSTNDVIANLLYV